MSQLRYLQTLSNISAENNSTIVFPVPLDIVTNFVKKMVDIYFTFSQLVQALDLCTFDKI